MTRRLLAVAAALTLAACGEDDSSPRPASAAPQPAPEPDTVRIVPLSTSEHDRLLGAAFDLTNRLYAAASITSRTRRYAPTWKPPRKWRDSFGCATSPA
jgi:hypothetical protein